jgi:uncharacterized membrane protein YdjX (TVP38/TMEM64 family)
MLGKVDVVAGATPRRGTEVALWRDEVTRIVNTVRPLRAKGADRSAALRPPNARPLATWKLVTGGLLFLVVVALAQLADVGELLRRVQAGVAGLGAWAPVAFIAIYVGTTLLAGPGMPFTLASPLLFGPVPAFGIMVIASSLSAAGGFLIARHLARDAVRRRLAGNETFERVNALIEQHAWIIIPFVRIVPMPFALNNYGFGLTPISFWRYLALSEVGMVPMNAVLVLGAGSVFGLVSASGSWPLIAVAVVAGVIVLAVLLAGRRVWAAPSRVVAPERRAAR